MLRVRFLASPAPHTTGSAPAGEDSRCFVVGFPALPVPGFRAEEVLGCRGLAGYFTNGFYCVHAIKSNFTLLFCSAGVTKFKKHTTAQGSPAGLHCLILYLKSCFAAFNLQDSTG